MVTFQGSHLMFSFFPYSHSRGYSFIIIQISAGSLGSKVKPIKGEIVLLGLQQNITTGSQIPYTIFEVLHPLFSMCCMQFRSTQTINEQSKSNQNFLHCFDAVSDTFYTCPQKDKALQCLDCHLPTRRDLPFRWYSIILFCVVSKKFQLKKKIIHWAATKALWTMLPQKGNLWRRCLGKCTVG